VSWHATRIFFGFNLACEKKKSNSPTWLINININIYIYILFFFPNGKAGKSLKQAIYEATGAVQAS
jgi:hypothetical protein